MSHRAIFALLASGILLAAPASAQRWSTGPMPRAGACFYEFPNYRGRYFCARSGEDMPAIPNGLSNRVGSIRVFGGARVIVYSYGRFNGAEHWIDYNVPDLRYDGWYDRIGSARLSWEPRYADRYDRERPRGTSGYYEGQRGSRDERGENPQYGNNGQTSRYGNNGAYRDSPGNGAMTRQEAQAVVRSAYLNVLGREPDPASSSWVDHVLNDHWSQQQLESALRNSAEYRSKHSGR